MKEDKKAIKKQLVKKKKDKVSPKVITKNKVITKGNNSKIKPIKNVIEDKNNRKKERSERKHKSSTVILISSISIVFGLVLGSLIVFVSFNMNFINSTDNKLISVDKYAKEFMEIYNDISDNYYENVDKQLIMERAISALVGSVGDPYSSFLSKEDTQVLAERLEGSYSGIGAEITRVAENDLQITYIFKNSPAEKAELKVTDKIIKVNDMDINELAVSSVAALIKGKAGTDVSITIERDGVEKIVKVVRGNIKIDNIQSEVFEKNNKKIGYISINIFSNDCVNDFEKVLKSFEKQKINSLVIDVRYNSGGYLERAADILSLFLNKKEVMYQLKTKENTKKVYSLKNSKRNINVVVLTNEYSASASEILAAAMQESYNGKIVGKTTYGKGTVQETKTLTSGAMVKLTIQEWLTPKGNIINNKGVKPDFEIEQAEEYYSNPNYETDVQLQKGLEILSN